VRRHTSCRWVIGLALSFTLGMTIAASVRAEENHSAGGGRFALEFEECPKTLAEGVRRCIGIEVGGLLYGVTEGVPAGSDRLTIRCAGNYAWIEAAGATDTTPLEKLLRLDQFPGDAAPRALALASLELMAAQSWTVRERIDGKRDSLPPATTRPSTPPPPAAAPRTAATEPRPKSAVSAHETRIGLAGSWRTFLVERGPSLWGGQVQASTRIRRIWQVAADADVVGAQRKVENLGETSALLLSCGATLGVRTGDSDLGTSFGLGGRIGVARLWGSSADPENVSAATVWRPWGGPMAAASFFGGFWRFALTLIAEAGHSLLEPEGQAGGATVISLRSPWAAIYLGAGVRP
jgi:hypothetical protein